MVTGQAPPNLTLSVVDMTFNGAVLGNGRSDEEGLFEIQVTALPAGHRIGILLAEADAGLTYQETLDKYFPSSVMELLTSPILDCYSIRFSV